MNATYYLQGSAVFGGLTHKIDYNHSQLFCSKTFHGSVAPAQFGIQRLLPTCLSRFNSQYYHFPTYFSDTLCCLHSRHFTPLPSTSPSPSLHILKYFCPSCWLRSNVNITYQLEIILYFYDSFASLYICFYDSALLYIQLLIQNMYIYQYKMDYWLIFIMYILLLILSKWYDFAISYSFLFKFLNLLKF